MRVFGIDFGTTFTVVSWQERNADEQKTCFLQWENGRYLLPTEIENQFHLKRRLANSFCDDEKGDVDKNIYEYIRKFFTHINEQIDLRCKERGLKTCVLSVPVRFNDIARNAIKAAAISAGFHVLKLLAEPVAAAIYALHSRADSLKQKNGYYLIYDLGGGTFDATLLKLYNGVFQILSVDGLSDFGGLDIDKLIAQEKNITLLEAIHYKENNEYLNDEKMCQKIRRELEKTYQISEKMLEENQLNYEDIDQLVLCGGSSKLPFIFGHFKDKYDIANIDLEPDLLVAAGAGLHAYNLAYVNTNFEQKNQLSHMLIDAIPFDLGIETLGGTIEILIARNSPLPAIKAQYFQPVDGMNVLIHVVQGIGNQLNNAISLAKFEIKAIEQFEVIFMLDSDGILSIKIGDDIHVVSAKFGMKQTKKKDSVIEELYSKALQEKIENIQQEQYINYLKQALQIELSNEARDWLIARYEIVFSKN